MTENIDNKDVKDVLNEKIPAEKFAFVQENENLHDIELQTKARGFFADAMIRFRKNRSSVIAAYILLFLILYAIFAPMISQYTIDDKDPMYVNYPPFVPETAKYGFINGARNMDSQNEKSMDIWYGIGEETGMNPVIKILGTKEVQEKYRGQWRTRTVYNIKVNMYYALGIVYRNFRYEDYEKLQQWQNETGIQVIYPYVDPQEYPGAAGNPNIWYQVDNASNAKKDKDGNYVPAYMTDESKAGAPYNSIRIKGDDGSWVYSYAKSGSVQCRICYYNFYIYQNGHEPSYLMGTNVMGNDLFSCIGLGARFSLIFAVLVSAINLSIGAVYGAIQGYYGGAIDMTLDRISDILSGVPFVVVTTLFQLHLAQKVGVIPSFLFAFVLTGWIGMAALTRKQFYRFKSQEFVMAARTLGASDWRLMFKHIFPNAIGTIITSCALVIPGVIGSETSMTYLGIVDLSTYAGTTIGTLLSQGNAAATSAPHAILWPSVFLGLLMICFNLFGNGLRDAFNPTTRGVDD